MLRLAHHHGKHEEILEDHLGRKVWGTPGAYLRRSYLLAFVEETGAQDLLDGAEERGEDNGADPAALVVANKQNQSAYRPRRDVTTIEWHKESKASDLLDEDKLNKRKFVTDGILTCSIRQYNSKC